MCAIFLAEKNSGNPHASYCIRFLNSLFNSLIANIFRNLFDVYLKPYFLEAYRPIRKGEIYCRIIFSVVCSVTRVNSHTFS